ESPAANARYASSTARTTSPGVIGTSARSLRLSTRRGVLRSRVFTASSSIRCRFPLCSRSADPCPERSNSPLPVAILVGLGPSASSIRHPDVDALEPAVGAVVARGERHTAVDGDVVVHQEQFARRQRDG